jgi:Protein of unknown function (DUF3617)
MKTIYSTILLSAMALMLVPARPVSAADRLQTGQWEFSSTTDGKANTFKQCVTAEKAGSVNGDTKTARAYAEKEAAGHCTIQDYKVDGNVVSYAMTCGSRTIRSTATYRGDTFEGDLISKNEGGPEIVSHVKARRLGNCP